MRFSLYSNVIWHFNCTDILTPFEVRAAVTADNTSIRVSWRWLRQFQPTCIVDLVRVHYQPEGGSLIMYTVSNTTATSATLLNLQCDTQYTIWVYASGGRGHINGRSAPIRVSLPARGMYILSELYLTDLTVPLYHTTPAPPTPTDTTAQIVSTSNVRVTWQWTSSSPAPDCFNTTTVTYRPEGGSESSLQLSDPAATEATLNIHQCNANYTTTVVATAGEHRRENIAFFTPPGTTFFFNEN